MDESEKEKKKSIFKKIKSVKHIEIIVAALAVGIMLVIYFSSSVFPRGGNGKGQEQEVYFNDYLSRTQAQIVQLISNMDGAGRAHVVINWESSVELILAQNSNSASSTPIIISGGGQSRPIVIKENYPKALGVVVVVEGGESARLRVDIIMALSILLNLDASAILVLPANK
ncbi:MAG: hypothetical protein FWD86_02405 [Firmicutes bacterium]|nr:hypothetical protein [Bacillota bacterium]